jgi:hypothetical protein
MRDPFWQGAKPFSVAGINQQSAQIVKAAIRLSCTNAAYRRNGERKLASFSGHYRKRNINEHSLLPYCGMWCSLAPSAVSK